MRSRWLALAVLAGCATTREAWITAGAGAGVAVASAARVESCNDGTCEPIIEAHLLVVGALTSLVAGGTAIAWSFD